MGDEAWGLLDKLPARPVLVVQPRCQHAQWAHWDSACAV